MSAQTNVSQKLAAAYGDPAEDFRLDAFKYNSSLLVNTIYDYLSSAEQAFKGVTVSVWHVCSCRANPVIKIFTRFCVMQGDVSFDSNGIRIANLLSVYQYRFGKEYRSYYHHNVSKA